MLSWRRLHLFIKPITVVFSFYHRIREAKQIADLGKELIPLINEDLKNLMGQLGIEFGSGVKDAALSSLQKGISSVTEETAGAIEAYLNMVSGQVFQQTTILQGIWDMTMSMQERCRRCYFK